ncbi:MAG: sulfatase [Eubacteriales bacterium]|nr:sulfatase [Eubacteriales bacterium]
MPTRQNAIWIMADQLRSQALSCHGDPNVHTPNIDLLARTGLDFTQAVGGYPLCCPCRGSMLTSVYPHQCVPGHEYRMPPEMPTIADAFNAQGYHTAYIGKWHLDGYHESDGRAGTHIIPPERHGHFAYWLGYENNNNQYDCYVHGHDAQGDIPLTRLEGYETDALTTAFLEHLDTVGEEQPFFAVLSVQPPHDPYVAPPEYLARHNPAALTLRPNVPNIPAVQHTARQDLAGAYAMIENLDDNVGRVIRYLKQSGRWENTHVFFFSDHGDMHGSQGMFRKTNPYEEAIRVPFIISGCNFKYDHYGFGERLYPVNHVDIAPTTLSLCGLPIPEGMQGTDYACLRRTDRPKDALPDSAYIQNVIPTGHGDSTEFPWRGVVTTDGYKYVSFENMPWLLFNLNEDPYEQRNLAHNPAYAALRARLQARLRRWIDETGDSFPLREK